MHFQPFEGLKFHKYSGGACPRTPLAYDCSHVRVGADASDDHDGGGGDDYGVVVVVVPFRNSWFLSRRTWRPRPRPPAALWRSGGESRQENQFHPTSAECSGWKKEVWLWKKVPSIPKAFNPTTEEGSHKSAGYPDPLPSGWNMVFIRGPVSTFFNSVGIWTETSPVWLSSFGLGTGHRNSTKSRQYELACSKIAHACVITTLGCQLKVDQDDGMTWEKSTADFSLALHASLRRIAEGLTLVTSLSTFDHPDQLIVDNPVFHRAILQSILFSREEITQWSQPMLQSTTKEIACR